MPASVIAGLLYPHTDSMQYALLLIPSFIDKETEAQTA
jgi:hypothetical protein